MGLPPKKQLNPKYTKIIVKRGGGSIMVWGSFTISGVGQLLLIFLDYDRDIGHLDVSVAM